jgi:hypothetical protein
MTLTIVVQGRDKFESGKGPHVRERAHISLQHQVAGKQKCLEISNRGFRIDKLAADPYTSNQRSRNNGTEFSDSSSDLKEFHGDRILAIDE